MEGNEYHWEVPAQTTRKKNQLTVFGIGTTGIEVVEHLYKMAIKDVRFIACHADHNRLRASPVYTKVWYALELAENKVEQDLYNDLKAAFLSSELTLIVTDLANPVDCHLAMETVRIARELGEFTIAVVGKHPERSETLQRQTDQAMQSIQQLATSSLICRLDGVDPQQHAYQLGHAVFSVTACCEGYTDQDFDVWQKIIESPGRIAVMLGRGVGDTRITDAVEEVVAQLKQQQFTSTLTQKLLLQMSYSGRNRPIMVREHTAFMESIMHVINTEPTDVRMGFIMDERMGDQLVVNVLLWMPLEKELLEPVANEKRQSSY